MKKNSKKLKLKIKFRIKILITVLFFELNCLKKKEFIKENKLLLKS